MKRIYGYKMKEYWSNIATVESYYQTNMDFLKPEVRRYFSMMSQRSTLRLMIFRLQSTMQDPTCATV